MVLLVYSVARVRRYLRPMRFGSEITIVEDQDFVQRIREKIERMTGCSVEVRVDHVDEDQLQVELVREVPLVVMGSNIYEYSGFARMCIEYAAASIRRQRPIDVLEFHVLLARN